MISGGQVVLLVEDREDDVFLTLRAFKRSNIANPVVVASDGEEALDYLFARGKHADRAGQLPPALVMLDLNLPGLDGLGVLKAIRADAQTRLIPVVILTSSLEEQDRLRGYSLGANSFVRKPVDFVQFAEAVKLLGMYWLIVNEPLDGTD